MCSFHPHRTLLVTSLGYCVYLLTSGSQLKGNACLEHAVLVEGEEKELVEGERAGGNTNIYIC